jgi:DNA-directed RNA polymerase subunit F
MTEQVHQQSAQRKAKVITIPEAKEILSRVDAEHTDQIQKRTMDYLLKFSKADADKARKLRKVLIEETGLSVEEATEIVNIMPKSPDELRVFTSGWRKLIPTATTEKILKLLQE